MEKPKEEGQAVDTMPAEQKGGGAEEAAKESETPQRRSSSRLQAKAEKNAAAKTDGETITMTSRQKSRSRSTSQGRAAVKVEEEKLTAIEEEEEQVKETTATPNKRGRRGTTPTRTLPARATAKSPSREPAATTPVRLTRSARRLGYKTPEIEKDEQPRLTFSESPSQVAVSPKEESVATAVLPADSPEANNQDVITIEEDEPMDVSAAEFIEVTTAVQEPIGIPFGFHETVELEDGGINKDEVVTEKIELQVERTLETQYRVGEESKTDTTYIFDLTKDEEEDPEAAVEEMTCDRGSEHPRPAATLTVEETAEIPDVNVDETSCHQFPVLPPKENVFKDNEMIGETSAVEAFPSPNEENREKGSTPCPTELTPPPLTNHEAEEQVKQVIDHASFLHSTPPSCEEIPTDGEKDSVDIDATAPDKAEWCGTHPEKKKKKKKERKLAESKAPEETAVLPGNEAATGDKNKKAKKKKFPEEKGEGMEIEHRPKKKKKAADAGEDGQKVKRIRVPSEGDTQEGKENICDGLVFSEDLEVPKAKKIKKAKKVDQSDQVDSAEKVEKKEKVKISGSKKGERGLKRERKMVDSNDSGSASMEYPDLSLKRMFSEPTSCINQLTSLLQAVYAWNNTNQRRTDDLPDNFLNNDPETIWQFIAHKNRQINKDWRKHKTLLDEAIAVSGLPDEVGNEEEESSIVDEEESDKEDGSGLEEMDNEDEMDEEDEECDLFNLNDEDLKDLERELEDEGSMQNRISSEKENEKPARKFRKSIVDDKFFNLAEMDAFCDEAEKQNGEEGILLEADDSWGGPANYRYEDFFGRLDDVVEDGGPPKQQMPKKRKAADQCNTDLKKKSVRFALEDEHEDDTEVAEDIENIPKTSKTLFGETKTEEAESRLKADIRKLKESIRKYEEENLQPRSWELSGEVTAQQRAENELLETHLQFDNTAKRAPEITEEFTERIEALIKQRIKDQAFDDVIRIKKVDEKKDAYRNEAIEEQETMKKSLSEVYEKEYQQAAGQTENAGKENPLHKELEERMNSLFHLVDAMSHFEYTPPAVRPEIKVVSNMAALQMEEVGMQASTDAQLLAPEEIRKKQKGELKADEERTKTDKLRQRRKKKTKQRAMIEKVGAEKALAGQIEQKMKKKKGIDADKKEDNLKSSNFFSKLQDTVQKELKDKTTKKKKVKSEKVKTSGSKFKL